MRGTTNAQQMNLPRNGTRYLYPIFGANAYGGYYMGFAPLTNADKVNITLNGMGVVGVSWWSGQTLADKVIMTATPEGLYFQCNDSSVVGNTTNPQITITGGGA